MLTGGGDRAANAAESLRPFKRTEAAGHLLFDFHHPDIPFSLVVVKRYAKVVHERQHLPFEVAKPHRQVPRWRLFGTTAFFPLRCRGRHGVGLKPSLDHRIIARLKGLELRRREADHRCWSLGHCGFDREQEFCHIMSPWLMVLLVDEVQFAKMVRMTQRMMTIIVGEVRLPMVMHRGAAELPQNT